MGIFYYRLLVEHSQLRRHCEEAVAWEADEAIYLILQ